MGYVRFHEGICIERPRPQKMGLLLVAYTFIHQKKGGALLLLVVLVVDFSQFSKSYTFYQKNTLKRNDTSTSTTPLPPFRIFWAIQHNNKTMSLVVEKTKKRCHFNHSHRIYGTSIFTIHSPFPMWLVY